MKILDPLAIKEIDNNNMDIPIVITNMNSPSNTTTISKVSADQSGNLVKIVTGKEKLCDSENGKHSSITSIGIA